MAAVPGNRSAAVTNPTERPHPRPMRSRRDQWLSLDGDWGFRRDPRNAGLDEGWQLGEAPWNEHIVVPFAWETEASGIGAQWMPIGWYQRGFTIPQGWDNRRRLFLLFGAVHHESTVWVNGVEVGRHVGGYEGFEFDITEHVHDGSGSVVVRVMAPIDKRDIPHGKQRSLPIDDYDACSFRPTSGIWQTVWLEARPANHITAVFLRPVPSLDGVAASVTVSGPGQLSLQLGDQTPVTVTVAVAGTFDMNLPVADPHLWSPEDPHLYSVCARLTSVAGEDTVDAYTGLRRIESRDGQFYLNGVRTYFRGVLDQGYWPATGLTAPNDEALRRDLKLARAAGFTMVRKHLKFENPRQLLWADRMGMLMWVEPPSFGRYSKGAVESFEALIGPMVEQYGNHPSVVIWGLYNEEWGLEWRVPEEPELQRVVARAYELLHAQDSTRPIVDNSGWAHVRTDIIDWHVYTADLNLWAQTIAGIADGTRDTLKIGIATDRIEDRPLHVPAPPGPRLPLMNSEYGVGLTSTERGWHLKWQTLMMRRHDAFCGYVYCELIDIEHETAGIYTDHRVLKELGRVDPADVNADTVIIPDLIASAPGSDFAVGAPGQEVVFDVRISHHGHTGLQGTLTWCWEHDGMHAGSADVLIEPFVCSAPIRIQLTAVVPPLGHSISQLILAVTGTAGELVARLGVEVHVDQVGA